jgi:hypothetical protein
VCSTDSFGVGKVRSWYLLKCQRYPPPPHPPKLTPPSITKLTQYPFFCLFLWLLYNPMGLGLLIRKASFLQKIFVFECSFYSYVSHFFAKNIEVYCTRTLGSFRGKPTFRAGVFIYIWSMVTGQPLYQLCCPPLPIPHPPPVPPPTWQRWASTQASQSNARHRSNTRHSIERQTYGKN